VGAFSAQVPIARSAHTRMVGEQASRFQHASLRLRNVVRGSEGCELRSPGGGEIFELFGRVEHIAVSTTGPAPLRQLSALRNASSSPPPRRQVRPENSS
jgi:hypothetical protein